MACYVRRRHEVLVLVHSRAFRCLLRLGSYHNTKVVWGAASGSEFTRCAALFLYITAGVNPLEDPETSYRSSRSILMMSPSPDGNLFGRLSPSPRILSEIECDVTTL